MIKDAFVESARCHPASDPARFLQDGDRMSSLVQDLTGYETADACSDNEGFSLLRHLNSNQIELSLLS
jgi:hypothetical protein